MQEFFDKLVALFVAMQDVKILIASILFVLALTVFYYFIIKFLRVNGAKIAETVFVCIFCFCAVTLVLLNSVVETAIFLLLPLFLFLFVAIVFSTEFRRTIWDKSNKMKVESKHGSKNYNEEEVEVCINEIIKAVQNLSKNDMGAILVLSNGNVPDRILPSGTIINSDIRVFLITINLGI